MLKIKALVLAFFIAFTPQASALLSTDTCYGTDASLMAQMNGADTSTTFIDDSDNAHTITAAGDAQIDTSQSKFGGASGIFNTDDDVSVADNATFNIDTSDFTIDFWVRFADLLSESVMFRFAGNTTTLYLTANALAGRYDINVAGTTKSYTTVTLADTWYHIAVTRASGTVRFYQDGVQISTDLTASGDIAQGEWRAGQYPGTGIDFNGWFDGYRIVLGQAIWTANFTPPSAEYTLCAARKNVMIID